MRSSDGHITREAVAVGFWENVFINVWRLSATMDDLHAIRMTQRQLLERHPRIANLTVLEPIAIGKPMNAAERDEAASIARDVAKSMIASAHVVEGTGFGPAAARAVLAGINLLSAVGHPVKVMNDVPSGASWLLLQVGGGATRRSGDLVAAVEEARGRLPPRR